MMENRKIDKIVSQWLESGDGRAIVGRLAREISRSALVRNLSTVFLTKDPFGDYPPGDLTSDIEAELVLFITENSYRLRDVLTPENRYPTPFLKQAFINHWITRTRTPGTDPQRYLYRRARDIFRKSGKFHVSAQAGKFTAFSMEADSRRIPALTEEDLREIGFPHEDVKDQTLRNTEDLLRLAAHFWKQVSERWGKLPVWIDIRDFVAWIGRHVFLKGAVTKKGNSAGQPLINDIPDPARGPDTLYYDRDLVAMWAEKFSNRLKEKEKPVFILHYGRELGLEAIARELGYGSSSGPHYVMGRIQQKMRSFLVDLPWVSPDDFNQDAFGFFMETVLSILNNTAQKP